MARRKNITEPFFKKRVVGVLRPNMLSTNQSKHEMRNDLIGVGEHARLSSGDFYGAFLRMKLALHKGKC